MPSWASLICSGRALLRAWGRLCRSPRLRSTKSRKYTQWFVKQAIEKYKVEGLEATIAHYNTPESVDGQWYMFISDQSDTIIAHGGNPDLIDRPVSAAVGPNNYPAGEAVVAVADEDGEWFSYTFPNPGYGGVEMQAFMDGGV